MTQWKLVPVEPTDAMLRAVDDEAEDKYLARGRAVSAWVSMFTAAPLPPAGAGVLTDAQIEQAGYELLSALAGIDCYDINLRDQAGAYEALDRYRAALQQSPAEAAPVSGEAEREKLLAIAHLLSLATDDGDDIAQGTHYIGKDGRIHCKGSFLDLIERARAALRTPAPKESKQIGHSEESRKRMREAIAASRAAPKEAT